MSELRTSDLAPGLALGPDVVLGEGIDIGANVVIHAGSRVGDGCTLQDGAVIGKPPKLGPRTNAAGHVGNAVVDAGATVCSYAIVFAGAHLREGSILGDHALVRERATVGPGTVVGASSAVGIEVELGARVRMLNNVILAPRTLIEDEAELAPNVVTTTRRWNVPGEEGNVVLRRGARIGVGAILLAPVEIGAEAVVGAGSVVKQDVAPASVVAGSPARVLRTATGPDAVSGPSPEGCGGSGEPSCAEPAPAVCTEWPTRATEPKPQ